ncbi:lectin-like domain-containing protein [Kitasatospora aureofaciens]|uniref:lectin-like domain-containing protein n=1 Tax=Kitasatospora aureofaciens TaxID=1894 RepID=UPI0036F49AD7
MATPADAAFPISESLTGSTTDNPNWKLRGDARLNGSLELTPNSSNKAGTAFLDEAFPSTLGIAVDFDYAVQPGAPNGDGFCLYLIDGDATTEPGGSGAGLGYAPIVNKPGVTRGYVGIGFDSYGNFASDLAGPGGPGSTPNMVGVRGSGDRSSGFRWLTGARITGGFGSGWDEQAHAQVVIADGRITVRLSSGTDPGGRTVIDRFDLHTPGQAPMPPTFKLGFSAGTGAATAAHRIRNLRVALPAEMPLRVTGPTEARAGSEICYTVTVRNEGPNDVPDAVLEGEVPAQLSGVKRKVTTTAGARAGRGRTTGGLRQPLTLPRGATATVTVCGTIKPGYAGPLTFTARCTSASRSNTAVRGSATIDTDVTAPAPEAPLKVWQQGTVEYRPLRFSTVVNVCITHERKDATDPGPLEHLFTAPTGIVWTGYVAVGYYGDDMTVHGSPPEIDAVVSDGGRTLTFTHNPHVYTSPDDRDVLVYVCGAEADPDARPGRYTDGTARIGAAAPAALHATVLGPEAED